MSTDQNSIARWQAAEEGQFFERKSAIDRSGGAHKPRKAAAIAHDIAETLAAFANADGGELVVGIEDDGTVSGVPHYVPGPRLLLQAETIQNDAESATMASEAATISSGGRLHHSPSAPETRENEAMSRDSDAMKGRE